MLYLYYKAEVPNRKPYFIAADVNVLDGNYRYITDDFCRDFIKGIDNTEVVNSNIVNSEVLGYILPRRLSGGVQGLLLLYASDDYYAHSSQFGSNCLRWLYKLSTIKDVHVVMDYVLTASFEDEDGYMEKDEEFNAIVVDDGYIMHTYEDYFETVVSFKYRKEVDLDPEYRPRIN